MIPAFPKPGQVRRVPKYLCEDGVFRFPDGREICNQNSKKGRDEYERRKREMWTRQGRRCALQIAPICRATSGRWSFKEIQFDHENGRGAGKQDDRIEVMDEETGKMKPQNAAVCPFCNSDKGSRRMPYLCLEAP